jgi:hypothetical protein
VTDCRLEGPYEAAVIFAGPAADVVLSRDRTFAATDGLLFRKAAQVVGLALSSCTFCSVERAGLHFEVLPADGSRLTLTRNLFARTGRLALADDVPADDAARASRLAPGPQGNVRDPASQDGLPLFAAAVAAVELATDAGDDDHFLRTPASAFPDRIQAPGVP